MVSPTGLFAGSAVVPEQTAAAAEKSGNVPAHDPHRQPIYARAGARERFGSNPVRRAPGDRVAAHRRRADTNTSRIISPTPPAPAPCHCRPPSTPPTIAL